MNTPDIIQETGNYFRKVYAWMALGLAISGLTAYAVASNDSFVNYLFSHNWIFFALIILQIGTVIYLASQLKRISPDTAFFLFLLYCFLTGLTLSSIFLVYTFGSIVSAFLSTAIMFAVMSLYGLGTKRDLTSTGKILTMGLFGIIIAMLINMFLRSAGFDLFLSVIAIIIFTGLTAYDTQKLKRLNVIGNEGTPEDKKEAIIGALTLYLDFINLFLHLLRIMGKRRD